MWRKHEQKREREKSSGKFRCLFKAKSWFGILIVLVRKVSLLIFLSRHVQLLNVDQFTRVVHLVKILFLQP